MNPTLSSNNQGNPNNNQYQTGTTNNQGTNNNKS